jgi:phosphate transport system substrate-binding protein
LSFKGAAACIAAVCALNVWPAVAVHLRAAGPVRVAVIVNRANPVADVTTHQLRDLLMGRQNTWPNGRRVTLVLREPGEATRAALLRFCCHLSSEDYDRGILQAVFTGEALAAPKLVTTADAVKKFVFNVPGAIGVVSAADLDDTVNAVRIDGKATHDKDYNVIVP